MAIEIIRKNDSMSAGGSRVRSLPMGHPGLKYLREMDVVLTGIDERMPPLEWGEEEDISQTHLLFFVIDGIVSDVGGGSDAIVKPGEMLLVPAGIRKRLRIKTRKCVSVWIHVSDTPRWNMLRYPVAQIQKIRNPMLLYVLQENLLEQCLLNDSEAAVACTLLSQLWIHTVTQEIHTGDNPMRREMREKLAMLWNDVHVDLAYPWDIESMAHRLCVSEGHFHRMVRDFNQSSPMEMVTRFRMERAAGLLRTTSYKLNRITAEIGYNSLNAFSDAFKRHTGLRPGQYRHTA
jgi:AraC-like DNA-binding protein